MPLEWTQGQEVKFHEIEIHFFMRSKLNLFMRSNLFINIWQFWSGGQHFDREIKIQKKELLGNFDLMKNSAIRRSNQLLGISTLWSIIRSPKKVEFRSHEIQPYDQFPWNETSNFMGINSYTYGIFNWICSAQQFDSYK